MQSFKNLQRHVLYQYYARGYVYKNKQNNKITVYSHAFT